MVSRLAVSLLLVPSIAAADPRGEVQIDALGLLDQRVELSATGLITPNLGVSLTLADQLDGTSRQVALSLPVFAQRAFHGFFVEPGLLAGGRWSGNCLSCVPDINKNISAEVLFGWSFLFDSSFTVAGRARLLRQRLRRRSRDLADRLRQARLRVLIATRNLRRRTGTRRRSPA
jgi:hypothetical protein